jgi:type II secretory pathway component GspD/PulD (secretin)
MLRVRAGFVGLLAVALCVGGAALRGQEKGKGEAEGKKRVVYPVKAGSAKDFAALLNKHFGGQVEEEVLPDANVVLIAASPAVFPELLKLLEQADRRPRTVSVEVVVVDLPPQEKPVDEKDLAGTPADVMARLKALQKDGRVGELRQVEVTALENQQATARVGESKPIVMGVTQTGTGRTARNLSYRNVGVQVKVTPRLSPEGAITLELEAEEARLSVPPDSPVIGQDEKGQPIQATTFVANTLNGRLGIPDGKMVVARDVKATTKAGEGRTLVLVTARVLDGGK